MRMVQKESQDLHRKKVIVIDLDNAEDVGTEIIIRHLGAMVRVVADDDMFGEMIVQHLGSASVSILPETCKEHCIKELDKLMMTDIDFDPKKFLHDGYTADGKRALKCGKEPFFKTGKEAADNGVGMVEYCDMCKGYHPQDIKGL